MFPFLWGIFPVILRTVKVASAGDDYAEAVKKVCISKSIIVLICIFSKLLYGCLN